MPGQEDITERLSEFKSSGLIETFEILITDDSVRVRIVAPRGQDADSVKSFIVETLSGVLSESQVSVEQAA